MRNPLFLLVATLLGALGFVARLPGENAPGAIANKRLLLVTHSGGFVHPSVATAEEVLKAVGPKNGFDVTCWRFTGDPNETVKVKKGKEEVERNTLEYLDEKYRAATRQSIEKAHCGRVNKETLKNFDIVLFFTTGDPVNKEELADLREWVKAGGALAGTHCATDTLYKDTVYGDLIGAYFKGHPPGLQKIKVKVEDPKHPAAAGFTNGMDYQDEMYVFKDAPYSREKLHIILSIDPASFDPKNLSRSDKDYAISWCRTEGKGRVFYTSFGHDPKVWKDERYQKHLLNGLKWATGELPGSAEPSGRAVDQ